MNTNKILRLFFGLIAISLFITLQIKIVSASSGMILPGVVIGEIVMLSIVLGSIFLTLLITHFRKNTSFLTTFFIIIVFPFTFFQYYLHTPSITIIVPNGYIGRVDLVLSNVEDNILLTDSNGIGYINKTTFNQLYSRPIVKQVNGKSLEQNLVGFNNSTFYAKGRTCCVKGKEIISLSFEIVPGNKIGQKQYFSKNLVSSVNRDLTLLFDPDDN